MDKEYFEKLKEAAPKMMEKFCEVYGYTEYQGEYYNNYLIKATKPKISYISVISRIVKLGNIYDGCLEMFKLDVMAVIGHLEANGYSFDCSINLDNQYEIIISNNSEIVISDSKHLEYALQDASVIAAKDLELSLK